MKEKGTYYLNFREIIKWGVIGFVIGIVLPYIVPNPDNDIIIPMGATPAAIILYLIQTPIPSQIDKPITFLIIVNGFVIGTLCAVLRIIVYVTLQRRR